ncbi:MAG: proprotein convertase P-domain-containing protein [Planctomycetes bacterium]|nr:proprotein convertase P-domain-containing protein [Planctomycetota bacterium]
MRTALAAWLASLIAVAPAPPAPEPVPTADRVRVAAERARACLDLPRLAPFPEGRAMHGRGTTHVEFAQTAGGIPVEGARIRVHYDARGRLTSIDSTWRADPRPIGGPEVESEEAVRRALAFVASRGEPEPIEVEEEGLLITRFGELAREVRARIAEPPRLLRIRIDARTGAILESVDILRRADGEGRVFIPSPVVALRDNTLRDHDDAASAISDEAYVTVTLLGLDESGTLAGSYVTTQGTPNRVKEPSLRFLYDRSQPGFEEVMAYYHIDSVARFIHDLGFSDICQRQIQVFVSSQPPGIPLESDVSYFQPTGQRTGYIALGSGAVDDAEDGEIIVHEFGHAIQHEQVSYFGDTGEAAAIGEGFCDFLATGFFSAWSGGFGDDCFGDWDARGYTTGGADIHCLRSIPTVAVYPDDLRGRPHLDGLIYASALWEILRSIGREQALALAIETNFFLQANARFHDLGPALLAADEAIYDGAHAAVLRQILIPRGLLVPPISLEGYACAAGLPLRIPDADPEGVTSAVEWTGDARILSPSSVRVYVDIDHTFPADIEAELIAPDGTRLRLTPPTRFPVLFGDLQAPRDTFDALVGKDARGTWTLEVRDVFADDIGSLEGWGIHIANLVRGELNGDGGFDVADAVWILMYMFADGDLACETVADIDDNGLIDLADPILLLSYLFDDGVPPAEPFATPGHDPTPDDLRCDAAPDSVE